MAENTYQGDPGSWQQEWDRRSHTDAEFRQEIRELRERIQSYLKDIEERDRLIESMKEELTLQNKYWAKSLGMDK
jgi:hypothetical protein